MRLFDSHCHLQDPRIFTVASEVIRTSLATGVVHFAVNGVSEKDWPLVKEMSEQYPSIIPNFGIHPWYVTERTPNWMNTLKGLLEATPAAAVGEIGLDKGTKGRQIDFADQVEVFRQQLQLAKELRKPASIHCVRAFGDLLEILKSMGPFPAGVILHSYLGSAEMVPEFVKLGAYFSFSGFLMSVKESKAKKMLKAVPTERILLETDSPDALPILRSGQSLYLIGKEDCLPKKTSEASGTLDIIENSVSERDTSELPADTPNHPANIHHILAYIASMLEMPKEEIAGISFANAIRIFSYEGSKILLPEYQAASKGNPRITF